MFCGNGNNCLWIILILIVIFACGGNGGCNTGCNTGCGCNNNNNNCCNDCC